jgi:hypothetical protein
MADGVSAACKAEEYQTGNRIKMAARNGAKAAKEDKHLFRDISMVTFRPNCLHSCPLFYNNPVWLQSQDVWNIRFPKRSLELVEE